jgi:ADP-ribose pyrophosphatase YjhB (NUDIX family)
LAKINKNIKSRLIVINQTKTLLLKKHASPAEYSLVGGFVEEGETPREGLIREAFEEIGMKIAVDELFLLSKLKGKKNPELVKYYYLLSDCTKSFELKEVHKFESIVWMNLDEALLNLRGTDRSIFRKHFLESTNAMAVSFSKSPKPKN